MREIVGLPKSTENNISLLAALKGVRTDIEDTPWTKSWEINFIDEASGLRIKKYGACHYDRFGFLDASSGKVEVFMGEKNVFTRVGDALESFEDGHWIKLINELLRS